MTNKYDNIAKTNRIKFSSSITKLFNDSKNFLQLTFFFF